MTKLVIYLVCEPETPELAEAAVEGGADIVELGIPFSDPLAEGPTIQRASERALSRGMRTAECLECIAATRALVDVPLVPMTYAAILEAYGYERFVTASREAGATSAIVVDLPVEEHHDVPRIQLVAPTSTDDRIAALRRAHGRLALPRLADRHDGRSHRGLPCARGPRRADASDHRRAALRRLRHLDARSTPPRSRCSPTASSSARARSRSPRRARPRCATTSEPARGDRCA